MSNLIWLSEPQMHRIEPYFPLSQGVPHAGLKVGAPGGGRTIPPT